MTREKWRPRKSSSNGVNELRMKTTTTFGLMAALFLSACGDDRFDSTSEPTPGGQATRQAALGEPVGDYPSYDERVLLYLTNRLRTEPQAFNPEPPYDPTPPLRYDVALGRAARFHAQHIQDANCWCEDHSSCCELEAIEGGAQCAGPVTGCGATDAATRVQMFSSAYSGENMARGQATPAQAIEGWTFSPGHWANINEAGHRLLGTGAFDGAWVQDFGSGGNPPVIGDGIHFSNGQSTTFGATFYQPSGTGPQVALAIVQGVCHDLELVNGTAVHGAFEVSVALEPGCHRYYFHFTDANGNDLTYPSAGSFGVGVGGAECPFYLEERPADTCSPSGQTCETGDTRACYTGPFGTRDVGLCASGAERCVGGQWTGECRGDVHPAEEMCGNGLDENCDGSADEGCPEPDAGTQPDLSPQPQASDAEEGCSTANGGQYGLILSVLAGMMARRRWRTV